jgi:hypothetical protein
MAATKGRMIGRDKHRIFLDKYQHFYGIGIPLQGRFW